jgi:hypothetical protein
VPEKSLPVIYVKCCRIWPIIAVVGWGRCGLCGRRPVETPDAEELARYLREREEMNAQKTA